MKAAKKIDAENQLVCKIENFLVAKNLTLPSQQGRCSSGFSIIRVSKWVNNFEMEYTQPKIVKEKNKWRITWYEFTGAGQWKKARPTCQLNYIQNLEDRLVAAKLIQKLIAVALKKGWRYFAEEKEEQPNFNIIEAFQDHLKSKIAASNSEDTARSYKSSIKLFCEFLKAEGLQNIDVRKLQPLHVQKYIDKMLSAGKSHTTINNELIRTGAVYERIKKLLRLQYNPFKEVDKLEETESELYEPLTDPELLTVNIALGARSPGLRLAFMLIYYAWLRPKTIVQLQRKNFDFTERLIIVNPKAHKNRRGNKKQILQPLYDALISAGINELPADTYIFSDNLLPGTKPVHRQRLTEAWKEIVIDGLGINKKMYATKHTGATDFINLNAGEENLPWLQNQLGHSSLKESEAYLRNARVVRIDEKKTRIKKL